MVYGEPPFCAHLTEALTVLALRHATRPVIDNTAGEAMPSLFVEVDERVDTLASKLSTTGAKMLRGPRDEPWEVRRLIERDPDGNLICLGAPVA